MVVITNLSIQVSCRPFEYLVKWDSEEAQEWHLHCCSLDLSQGCHWWSEAVHIHQSVGHWLKEVWYQVHSPGGASAARQTHQDHSRRHLVQGQQEVWLWLDDWECVHWSYQYEGWVIRACYLLMVSTDLGRYLIGIFRH